MRGRQEGGGLKSRAADRKGGGGDSREELTAVNLLPFHGRKMLRKKTPGGRGEPEGRAVPHTHLLFFTTHSLRLFSLSVTLCFAPSLTPTHISCCPSQFPSSLLLFCSFTFLYATTTVETPPSPQCFLVWRCLHIPESFAAGTLEGRGLRAQSPIIHFV